MTSVTRTLPTQAPDSDARLSSLLLPLMMVLFISTLDQTIVASALSAIGQSLEDTANAPWIATSYLLTSAVTTLIFGKLGDMIGRKPMLEISLVIFVVGSVLCTLSPNMFSLILARGLQGIGGGGLNSLVMAIVGDLASPRDRAKHQATLGLVPAIAIVIGPVAGGFLVDHVNWIWIFLINVPFGGAAFWLIATRLNLTPRRSPHRLDYKGAVLSIVFTTCALLAAGRAGAGEGWMSPLVLGLSGVAIVALIAYVSVERKAVEPITPLSLFSSAEFSICCALFFLATAGLFAGLLFTPLMLQLVFGYSASGAGASIVVLLLGLIVASMVAGGRISRHGRYKAFPILGACLAGAGFVVLGTLPSAASHALILCTLAVLGAGLGLFIQVAVLAGQNAVEHRHLGMATGALNFFKTMGGAAGAAVLGSILEASMRHSVGAAQHLQAFGHVFLCASSLMAVAFVLALLLRERPLSAEMVAVAQGSVDVPEY